ncbi:hypothetical protein B1R32_102124 [Abditibacterium utsteinense]|uniref:Permuted papain-like amidase enzyme, YaeF/YiiX, C92 family n=1 Tax=Abditibacterium utsteinense TaxID=1960156 RepID=A0A2S8SWF6_9BACT|nr:hypothetical protein [Abditibacterium utsteinense]PQV65117.1 hypothetical protein B1R32_102124 [Abditibacterium utsteinense]
MLFHRARGINRIITAFSKSRYYHVGIYAGEFWVVESRPSGVKKRDLRIPGSGCYFQQIPAPRGPETGKQALEWATEQIGDGYAVLSVFSLVIDRIVERFFGQFEINWRQRDKYSCGEFVVKAFAHAGAQLFPNREAEVVAPWDFAALLPRRERNKPQDS